MKALILAGGLGTRLRPLTFTRPKHMLPIANRPHIERVFDLLMEQGIKEVVLLTSYLSEAFADVISRAEASGLSVGTTFEEQPLGTAGAFKNAQSFVGDDAFIAFNGDVVTDLNLGEVIAWHQSKGAIASIVLHKVDDPSAYGVVPTDPDGRVLGFVEKPPPGQAPTNLINAGIYVFQPEVLDYIPEGEVWSAERQLFPQLVEEGAGLYAVSTDAYWADIGTPQNFLQTNLDALNGSYAQPGLEVGPDGALIAADADVADDARVLHSIVGSSVVIETGAVVKESVLLSGATVGRGATVTRSTLGARARVGAGAHVSDTVIEDDGTAG